MVAQDVVVNGVKFVKNYNILCPNCGHSPVLQHTLSRSEKINRITMRFLCPECGYTWVKSSYIYKPKFAWW